LAGAAEGHQKVKLQIAKLKAADCRLQTRAPDEGARMVSCIRAFAKITRQMQRANLSADKPCRAMDGVRTGASKGRQGLKRRLWNFSPGPPLRLSCESHGCRNTAMGFLWRQTKPSWLSEKNGMAAPSLRPLEGRGGLPMQPRLPHWRQAKCMLEETDVRDANPSDKS
jgi:hypothetical protein